MKLKNNLKIKISNYIETVAEKSVVNKEIFTLEEIKEVKKDILKDLLIKIKAKATRNSQHLKEVQNEGKIKVGHNNYIYKKRKLNSHIYITNANRVNESELVNEETISYILKLAEHYSKNTKENSKNFRVNNKKDFINGSKASFLQDIDNMVFNTKIHIKYYKDNTFSINQTGFNKSNNYNNMHSFMKESENTKKTPEKSSTIKKKIERTITKIRDFLETFF